MADEQLREAERHLREAQDGPARRAWCAVRARAGLLPQVGLVFLDELHSFAPWRPGRATDWRQGRGLDGPLLPPTLRPPPALIAVAGSAAELEHSQDWLGQARSLTVVAAGGAAFGDPGPVRAALRPTRWIEVAADRLEHALERALDVAAADAVGGEEWSLDGPTPPPPPAPPRGEWIPWASAARAPSFLPAAAVLAPGLCAPDGRPAWLDPSDPTHLARVDLLSGASAPCGPPARRLPAVAATRDATGWLEPGDEHGTWWWSGTSGAPVARRGSGGRAIGIDPLGRAVWTGHRCTFDWWLPTPAGPVWCTPSDHDWPCGHAKKLYGFKDNDPLWVHLSADGAACLSVYEHDALISSGFPVRWRAVDGVALAERARGGLRALLFQSGDEYEGLGDPALADEDARQQRATVTLGPSPAARYAVGLEAPTWRLANGETRCLGGPAPEWIVCDDQHAERQRHRGRLLAGWDRWVVSLADERLWRHDLLADQVEDLGLAEGPIEDALAIPGTRAVLLISPEAAGRRALRVV